MVHLLGFEFYKQRHPEEQQVIFPALRGTSANMVQYSEMWFGLVQTWDVLIKRNSHYACPASQLSGDFKALLLSWSRVGRDRNFPRYITYEVI